MRRIYPPAVPTADRAIAHARDVLQDTPVSALDGGEGDGGAVSDGDLLHTYAYPHGHSWLRANMVGSLDGLASFHGFSEGLSGPPDKRVFGALRALADVILVGAGTARAENYRGARVPDRLTGMREASGQLPQPPIALVTRSLGLDPSAQLFTETRVRPIVLTCSAAPADRRKALSEVAEVLDVGETEVDLHEVRRALEARGLNRVLCEGGPTLLHGLLEADLVDELCLTISPQLVAGAERRLVDGPSLQSRGRLQLAGILEEDGELMTRYLVPRTEGGADSVSAPAPATTR